jgi:hypothetical protein
MSSRQNSFCGGFCHFDFGFRGYWMPSSLIASVFADPTCSALERPKPMPTAPPSNPWPPRWATPPSGPKAARTYMPVNAAADEARKNGRKLPGEDHNGFKKLNSVGRKIEIAKG